MISGAMAGARRAVNTLGDDFWQRGQAGIEKRTNDRLRRNADADVVRQANDTSSQNVLGYIPVPITPQQQASNSSTPYQGINTNYSTPNAGFTSVEDMVDQIIRIRTDPELRALADQDTEKNIVQGTRVGRIKNQLTEEAKEADFQRDMRAARFNQRIMGENTRFQDRMDYESMVRDTRTLQMMQKAPSGSRTQYSYAPSYEGPQFQRRGPRSYTSQSHTPQQLGAILQSNANRRAQSSMDKARRADERLANRQLQQQDDVIRHQQRMQEQQQDTDLLGLLGQLQMPGISQALAPYSQVGGAANFAPLSGGFGF